MFKIKYLFIASFTAFLSVASLEMIKCEQVVEALDFFHQT